MTFVSIKQKRVFQEQKEVQTHKQQFIPLFQPFYKFESRKANGAAKQKRYEEDSRKGRSTKVIYNHCD